MDEQLIVEELDQEEILEGDLEDDESEIPEATVIPDLQAEDNELEGLRR